MADHGRTFRRGIHGPSSAIWSFVRHQNVRGTTRGPLVLDALRALQSWRLGHNGRMFRFVRSSPFSPAERLSARLLHLTGDGASGRRTGSLLPCA